MSISSKGINLYDTLFSGQCFRMSLESDGSYTVVLNTRVVNIKEENDKLILDSDNLNDLDLVVSKYLDLERDYDSINNELCKKSEVIRRDIDNCDGYRILNQDKFEMFITYIISQNNNVKRIMGSVDKLCRKYGKKVYFREREYFLFPSFEEMRDISLEELREIGVGFRDQYIINALNKLKEDANFLEKLDFMSTNEAIDELTKIKGIGVKVASCILMFGYGRFDAYPIDTWVRHYVSENFKIKDNIKDISKFMEETFHEYSGLAIQYFYHIARNVK